MENKITNYNSLDDSQKINYVKNLLFNSNLNDALDSILKDEKKDLKWIKIIKDVLDEKLMINRIKEQCNLNDDLSAKAYVYSRILAILDFYKKTVILTEKVRTLPLPFIFLLVVIDAVRLPQGDMAVEESVRNEMWLRLVHHPWCITVIDTPPPCWCTTVAQLRSWHKHLYRHTCRIDA